MSTMPAAQTITAEEFINLPVPEHGRPWNLVDGEAVVNQPTPLHWKVQTRLVVALGASIADGTARGEVGVPLDILLDDRNVYAPDVLWYGPLVRRGTRPRQARQASLAGARPRR